jgi:uncharacterized protein
MFYRAISAYLLDLHKHFPVLFITGPRQSGKTTLAKALFKNLPYVLLESPDTKRKALNDPRQFLDSFPNGAILDEVQNVPELFSYLQEMVDENRKLRFVLTGSQNFLLNEKITQSLAGRTGLATLLPLSLSELKKPKTFLEVILKGFYPAIYSEGIRPGLFYPSYTQTYLERDVRQMKNIGNLSQFDTFLRLCAGRVGQIMNLSSLATDAGVSVNTIKAWLSILEASYLIVLLKPYYKNFNKRLIKSPKLYFTDTGLACHLLGIKTEEQLSTHYGIGALFENLIIMEFLKHRFNQGERDGLYYWRDSKGLEIDLLIDNGTNLQAIEMKSGKTFNADFLKNIRSWAIHSKVKATNSFIIYGGDSSQRLKEGNLVSWRNLDTVLIK